jgi:hypothetical protein
MRVFSVPLIALLPTAFLLLGCGAGHRKLTAIDVSPVAAAANASTRDTVQYTATGKFDDNSTRTLTVADGLSWKSSNPSLASIGDTGKATCLLSGIVMITATAPVDLTITVSTNVQNTSPKISGSASLNCM